MKEFKVVLILRLDELIDIDVALDVILLEGLLQDLIVLDVFIVMLGLPPDLRHGNRPWVASVDDLAINSTGSALLNLGQLQREEIVGPRKQLSTSDEERAFHHSDSVRL